MLHGAKITDSKPLKSSRLFEQASGEFATFHLSAAVLDAVPDSKSKVRLAVKLEEKYKNQEVTLAVLSKDNEMASLDLYLNCTQQVQLMLKGAPKGTEVSLSGYFEPKGDDMDDDMFGYGQEEGDEEDDIDDGDDDSDEEEEAGKGLVVQGKAVQKKALSSSLQQAQANKNKNAGPSPAAYGDDSDDDEEDDDEDLGDDLDDLDDDEDDSDEEEEVKPAVVSAKKIGKHAAPKVVEDSDDDDEDDEDDEEDADDKLVAIDSDSDDEDGEELDLEQVMKEATKKAKTAPQSILKKGQQPAKAQAQAAPVDGGKKKRNRKRNKKSK